MSDHFDNLMEGVEIRVYQGKNGRWYAHLIQPRGWPNFVEGLRPDEGSGWWDDVSDETEDGVRDKVCELAGKVYARRLRESAAMRAVAIQPQLIPPPRSVTL